MALLTAIIFLYNYPSEKTNNANKQLLLPCILLLLYTITFSFLPALVRAIIAITAISCTLSSFRFGKTLHLGTWGLFLLSLPTIPTLQFYLGYPMRFVIGYLSIPLLNLSGFAVIQEGVCLNWNGKLVLIDAPCSGIKMLWSGFYLTFTLICLYNLKRREIFLTIAFSLLMIIIGNTLRSTALFYVESGIFHMPSWGDTRAPLQEKM